MLQSIPRSFSTAIPTAAVGLKNGLVEMIFNPDFLMTELNAAQRVAVLKHEVLHIVFRHIYRSSKYDKIRLIYNLAADLVVNQYIGSWSLPENAVTLKSFPQLKLRENEQIGYYIEKLQSLEKEKISSFANVRCLAGHQTWDALGEESPDKLRDVAVVKLDKIVLEAREKAVRTNQYGLLPDRVREALTELQSLHKPTIDWRRSLRMFAQNSRQTRIGLTHKRISKRFLTRPGVRIRRTEKLLLAIDTSGSVSQQELLVFFAEIQRIYRCGAEIDIVECDAAVQRHYPYQGRIPEYVQGRGGTNFDPVFTFINERKLRYDGCIYLTDGQAASPTVKSRIRLLWVVIGDTDTRHLINGKIIKLDINE